MSVPFLAIINFYHETVDSYFGVDVAIETSDKVIVHGIRSVEIWWDGINLVKCNLLKKHLMIPLTCYSPVTCI